MDPRQVQWEPVTRPGIFVLNLATTFQSYICWNGYIQNLKPWKEMETVAGKIIPVEFKNNSLIGFHLPPTNSQPHLHLHVVCPTSDLPQGQFIMGVLIWTLTYLAPSFHREFSTNILKVKKRGRQIWQCSSEDSHYLLDSDDIAR